MFFNLLTKDLSITVGEYRPLAEALAVPDTAIPNDLDIDEFVINKGVVVL